MSIGAGWGKFKSRRTDELQARPGPIFALEFHVPEDFFAEQDDTASPAP